VPNHFISQMILRHTIPTTPGVECIYTDLLIIIDMFSSCAAVIKLSELKHSFIMSRQDCQKHY